MKQLGTDFSELGFDILGLKNLVYLGLDPDIPPACTGGTCDGGCTNGCYRCKPGSKND